MRKQMLPALFVMLGTGLHAQWLNYPVRGTPRTRDGKPDLTAKTPRTSNGKPDLSGVWHVQSESLEERRRLFGADNLFQTESKKVTLHFTIFGGTHFVPPRTYQVSMGYAF
jgi:hypothetical protein